MFLDFLPHPVVKRIHIDDTVDVRLLFTYRTFDGGDLSGTWRNVENTYLVVFIFSFFLKLASDIHRGDVDWCLDWDEIVGKTWEFDLNETHDGRTEGGNQRYVVGMFVKIFVLGVSVNRVGAFGFKDMSETYLLQDGVDTRYADVVGKLS